jgi:hypothetical protein
MSAVGLCALRSGRGSRRGRLRVFSVLVDGLEEFGICKGIFF